jgi:GNAT superfamily N-acetyltransferase
MSEAVTTGPAARPGAPGWEVRPARTEDVPAVADAVEALLVELGAMPPARAAIESEAHAHVTDPSLGLVLVATLLTGELAGVLTAGWARAIQVAGRVLTVEVLWTRRDWRDRGIGAALVEALALVAAAEGAGRVEVGLPRESFPALPATERFYLANGFERLGPRMRRVLS